MVRNTVFQWLLQLLSRYDFKRCVNHHEEDKYTKRFNCWQQLIVFIFAQAKESDSLRDIEVSLRSHYHKWYHLGLTYFFKYMKSSLFILILFWAYSLILSYLILIHKLDFGGSPGRIAG